MFRRGVTIIRKKAAVRLNMHYPKTAEGKEVLSRRVSEVHADSINQRLKSLSCPAKQKLELLEAVIKTANAQSQNTNN